jgi:hypothetical protein
VKHKYNFIFIVYLSTKSRDSSVGIASGYVLDSWGLIPGRGKGFSLLHRVQIGSRAHPASYPIGTGGSFPGGKTLGLEANHSPPFSAKVKHGGAITSLPHTSSLRGAQLIKHGDNFTFFMIYLSRLLVTHTMYRRMRGWNWKGCRRMKWWPNLRYYIGIFLEKMRETAIKSG